MLKLGNEIFLIKILISCLRFTMKKVVTVIFSVIIIGITVIGCGFSKFEAETTGEKINKRIECLFYQLRRLAMVHTL